MKKDINKRIILIVACMIFQQVLCQQDGDTMHMITF